MKRNLFIRLGCAALVALLLLTVFASCSKNGDVPDDYQDATCGGQYFRLYVPDGWTVQTQNGVSGATKGNMAVTMTECMMAEGATFDDFVKAHKEALVAELGLAEDAVKMETSTGQTLASGHKTDMCDMRFSITADSDTATDATEADGADAVLKVIKYRQILFYIQGDPEAEDPSDRFFLLTYSAPSDSDGGFATFDEGSEAVNGMLKNIRISNVPSSSTGLREPGVDDGAHEGMVLVSDKAVAFKFYAPKTWEINTDSGHCLVYVSEDDRSNVSVLAYALDEAPAKDKLAEVRDEYWANTRSQYERTLRDFVCDEAVTSTLGGKDATVYTYTYTVGGVAYKARQVIAIHSAAVYNLTYTALAEQYELHVADVEAMQEAFAFRTFGD